MARAALKPARAGTFKWQLNRRTLRPGALPCGSSQMPSYTPRLAQLQVEGGNVGPNVGSAAAPPAPPSRLLPPTGAAAQLRSVWVSVNQITLTVAPPPAADDQFTLHQCCGGNRRNWRWAPLSPGGVVTTLAAKPQLPAALPFPSEGDVAVGGAPLPALPKPGCVRTSKHRRTEEGCSLSGPGSPQRSLAILAARRSLFASPVATRRSAG
jgi:hypothetical protein